MFLENTRLDKMLFIFLKSLFNFIIFFSFRKFSKDTINTLKEIIEENRHGYYISLNKSKNKEKKLLILFNFFILF